jgi:hypothetical protein
MIWAVILEFDSEFIDFPCEISELFFDIAGFLILKRKDLLFYWT